MARKIALSRAAAIVFGITMLSPIVAAHKEMRITQFGYTARRQRTGQWEFLVKATGNASFQQEHDIQVEMIVKEITEHTAKPESLIEITSKVNTKPHTTSAKKLEENNNDLPLPNNSSARNEVSSPPVGYTNIAGLGFYKVHREGVLWETARRRCAAEGAHLLIINSAEEAAVVVTGQGVPTWSWLGFDDFDVEGEYITAHGTTLEEAGYVRWAPDEPAKELRCGVVNQDGLLGTGNCLYKRQFVCEFHSPGEHVRETRPPGLPVGYRAVGSLGYYRVRRDVAKWETARRRCAADGAHLMVPNTAEEATAVMRTSGLPEWFWLGFDDFRQKGRYINFNGEQLNTASVYSDFAPNEPVSKLHCGVGLVGGQLGTGNCDLKREYICELNKPNKTPDKQPLPASAPPAGYAQLTASSHYRVHRERVTWETARRRCAEEGAHLLFVNSQAEADAVLGTSGLSSWLWVGFDDFVAPGEYVYLDGTRLVDSGYVRWDRNEPTADLNCGVARSNGLLGTGNCRLEREYMCEWENRR